MELWSPLLRDEERGELHSCITGILKNHGSPLIEINPVRDHIHILFAQSKGGHIRDIFSKAKRSALNTGMRGWLATRRGSG